MSKKEESTPTTPKKTKASEEKTETPKASVKKDQKEKKTVKPKAEKKKVVKKSDKKPKNASKTKTSIKKTTKKVNKHVKTNTEKTTESKSGLTKYEQYVFEAISARATEDKPWVGFQRITSYIFEFIEEAKPASISKYAHSAADKLVERGILKKKINSYAIAKKGKKLELDAPKRKAVRTVPVKGEKRLATEEKTEEYLTVTQSGRVSRKLITV